MKRGTRIIGTTLLLGALTALGGCVYPPAYYQRTGVVYNDGGQYGGNAAVDAYDDADPYYAPGYYYNPWWGYGPYIGLGLGFYGGGYCCGGHHYHGPWRHGYGGHATVHGGVHSGSAGHRGGGHH
ncbi:MAG TPA: hypothetical protein VIE67_13190 [Rudaea sp.]|jgi:hypothetical protein|uniref:hypothetical protein n=1 Tax=Rudaea sp. TaxID=2136325 RepID=UPI002F9484B0